MSGSFYVVNELFVQFVTVVTDSTNCIRTLKTRYSVRNTHICLMPHYLAKDQNPWLMF